MASNFSWRSAAAVRSGLLAALASVVFTGSFSIVTAANQDEGPSGGGRPGAPATASAQRVAPFTTADVGACLTWELTAAGEVRDFQQTPCDSPHKFEISAREDLATYPSSEFGADAAMPDVTRQAQLRAELCESATLSYLGGRYDPAGRFTIAPILPPASNWASGDRTMLCGLQANDDAGRATVTTQPVAEADQARVNARGECLAIDGASALHLVDCAQDHQLETTSVVNVAEAFPGVVPSVEDQDAMLRQACTQAAIDYLGSEEALYRSTLQPFWETLPAESLAAGSESVNCSLVAATDAGFSTLAGSARGEFTINGQPPAPQPDRLPLREP